jgi:AcrR family transcriptional regulator
VPRPPGSNAPATRARILQAAGELFRAQGFSGTSMRELAETLGITTAALYYHFESKDDILDALVAPFLEAMDEFSKTPPAVAADTRQLVERLASILARHGTAMHGVVMNDPSATRHFFERRDFPAIMAGVVRVLAGADDATSLLRARCALGAIHGGLLSPPSVWARAGAEPTEDEIAVVVAFALAGLAARPPARPPDS